MSKKKINSILIICVLILWGILGYKFFKNNLPVQASKPTKKVSLASTKASYKKDTIVLTPVVRDPFLATQQPQRINHSIATTSSPRAVTPVKQKAQPEFKMPERWPDIQYLGYLQGNNAQKPMLLLKVNNVLYRKKINEQIIEDISVQKFYKDSIVLRKNSEFKTIKKV